MKLELEEGLLPLVAGADVCVNLFPRELWVGKFENYLVLLNRGRLQQCMKKGVADAVLCQVLTTRETVVDV